MGIEGWAVWPPDRRVFEKNRYLGMQRGVKQQVLCSEYHAARGVAPLIMAILCAQHWHTVSLIKPNSKVIYRWISWCPERLGKLSDVLYSQWQSSGSNSGSQVPKSVVLTTTLNCPMTCYRTWEARGDHSDLSTKGRIPWTRAIWAPSSVDLSYLQIFIV